MGSCNSCTWPASCSVCKIGNVDAYYNPLFRIVREHGEYGNGVCYTCLRRIIVRRLIKNHRIDIKDGRNVRQTPATSL